MAREKQRKRQTRSRLAQPTRRLNRGLLMLMVVAAISTGYLAVSRSHAASSVKPQLGGLVDRGVAPAAGYYGSVNSYIVQVSWAVLQPTQAGPIASNNSLDQAITYIRQQNTANSSLKMRLKLRVLGGINAPDWAKSLGGARLPNICDNNGAKPVCGSVGRFWTPEYGAAYVDLQNKLAAQYDGVPELQDNVIARCVTIYDEPTVRQISDAASAQEFRDAGYSVALDQQCQRDQIDAHRVWTQTRSSMAFNPYQEVLASGTAIDESITETMIDYCRASLGARCVVGNNSIQTTQFSGAPAKMYAKIKAVGPPIYFQTAVISKIANISDVLSWAAGEGAGMVELPSGYNPAYSTSTLTPYNQQLLAQAVGQVAPPTPTPTPNPTATPQVTPTAAATPEPAGGTAPSNTPTPTTLPVSGQPVSGALNLGARAVVKVDGVVVSTSGELDTSYLTNGVHTVTVVENGLASTRSITVNNHLSPWQTVRNQILVAFHGNRMVTLIVMIIALLGIIIGISYATTFWLHRRAPHKIVFSRIR